MRARTGRQERAREKVVDWHIGEPRDAVREPCRYVVARLTDVSIDDLLAGALLSPRTCPHCGRPPSDFEEEETVVEDQPVLKLVG